MVAVRTMLVILGLVVALSVPGWAQDGATDGVAHAPQATAAGDGLKPGVVLNRSNWQLARGLLPPEVLRHYREGHYENRIIDWPNGIFVWEEEFLASTMKNAAQLTVNERGTIVYSGTGEQPQHVCGFPFPNIDPDDPQAAVKVLWNLYYGYWYLGSSHNLMRLLWVNPDGIDREAGQDVHFLYYEGQPERYRTPNPNNFLMQFVASATFPTDLHGTTALTWRYRDSDKRDSNWAYVPALRRVRAVSPANRSDGFLGSDMSADDGPFFDGKPEDFEWKLIGTTDQFRYADPLSLEGKSAEFWLPSGGWRSVWDPNVKVVGFQDPRWNGVAWAPLAPRLAKRPMWIIEATPKDHYYLYGKIQLYIDRETYQGAYNRKFSWKGELINTYSVLGQINQKRVRPDGGEEWLWGSNMGYQTAENIKMNRATVAGLPGPGKQPPNDRRIRYKPSFYDFTTLQRFGK